MNSLPYELLNAIVHKVPPGQALLQVRLLNRTFCAMVTPFIFRRVDVTNTLESARTFSNILRSKTLACVVQEIVFRENYAVLMGKVLYLFQDSRQALSTLSLNDSTPEVTALKESLASSFSCLRDLSSIKSLSLSFWSGSRQFYSPHPWNLQMAILCAISGQTPLATLTSLSINGLYTCHGPQFDNPAFQNLFRRLDALRISLSCGLDPPTPGFRLPFAKFWEHTMQLRVLSPLTSFSRSLTSFTLHSDLDVGVVPRVDFSELDFPALTSLSLQMILFNRETHVEDFIVRHKHTLKSLYLAGCHITFHGIAKGPPQVWSQIWTRFADELEALVQLPVQPDHDGKQVWPYNVSYVHLDDQIGYSYLRVWKSDGESVIKANDDKAERMFREVVRTRQCKLTETAKVTQT